MTAPAAHYFTRKKRNIIINIILTWILHSVCFIKAVQGPGVRRLAVHVLTENRVIVTPGSVGRSGLGAILHAARGVDVRYAKRDGEDFGLHAVCDLVLDRHAGVKESTVQSADVFIVDADGVLFAALVRAHDAILPRALGAAIFAHARGA